MKSANKSKTKGAKRMASSKIDKPLTPPKTSLETKQNETTELMDLSGEVPAYLKLKEGAAQRGFENVRKEDFQLPRLKLMQQMSPEVINQKAAAGDILNSLSDENYGKELIIVPIIQGFSRVWWESKERDAKILCSSKDAVVPDDNVEKKPAPTCASCPNSSFHKDKSGKDIPPACTEFYNFPVLVNGKEPAALSFSRSKIAVAKRLMSKAMFAGKGLDLFALKFKLRSKLEQGQKFSYYNYEIVGAGFASESEYKAAEQFYNQAKGKIVTIHQENPSAEVAE